jgi:hypothetical protein
VRQRTAKKKAEGTSEPSALIAPDSPQLLPALKERLAGVRIEWNVAVAAAPERPDADRILAVARILQATTEALEDKDTAALEQLADGARSYLRSRRREPLGARPKQVAYLADLLNAYADHGCPIDQLAEIFLRVLRRPETDLGRDLFAAGIAVKDKRSLFGVDADCLARVTLAFKKEYRQSKRPGGERLVAKGLAAIGYRSARNVFSFRDQQTKRERAD